MRLSQKVTVYVQRVLFALLLVLTLAVGAVMLLSADRADRTTAVAANERAATAIKERAEALGRNTIDWSAWDETYEFVFDLDDEYVQANLMTETFDYLNINVYALFGADGMPVYLSAYDPEEEEYTEPSHFADLLLGNPALQLADGDQLQRTGIVPLDDGTLMLVGAGSVLPSDRNAPSRGTLIMGRLLDDSEIADIERTTLLDIELDEVGAGQQTDELSVVRTWSETTASRLLTDVDGRPVAILRVSTPRTVFAEGLRSLGILLLGLLAVVIVTTTALNRGLDRLVLSKIALLDGAVGRITTTGQPEALDVGGDDELHTLSTNITAMVDALEAARAGVELRVEERTAELTRALDDLRGETVQREAAQRERYESDARYRLLIDNLQDVVLTLGNDGSIRFVSPSAHLMFSRAPEDLKGTPIAGLLEQESADRLAQWLGPGLGAGIAQLNVRALSADGHTLDLEATLVPLAAADDEVQVILRDITARKRHESELLHIASHDYLTGMFNRRRFEDDLARELAQAARRDSRGAILWLDLDGFKDVNDTLGHRAGDELLVAVGAKLAATVRAESMLARLGGDEFAVVLPGAGAEEAEEAARRLIDEVAGVDLSMDGRSVRTSCSVGVVLYPEHGTDVDELLAHADMAMYRAKEMGRSRFKMFDESESWRAQIEEGMVWSEMLEVALVHGGLQAYAQPITRIDGRGIVRYELLVRMSDPDGAPIPPARFLPVAERTGLIVDVDLWILAEAIRLLEANSDSDFGISVNASPRSIADGRFLDELVRKVGAARIDTGRLTIEITETAILSDIARTQETLRRIKELGCRIALDDFGSGFTSFLHLKQLPIDDLKIDGSFVVGMNESINDKHLVRAMVEMSRALNMSTTAEFVESEDALDLLASFGVDMAQGFAIGHPGPADDVLAAFGVPGEVRGP